ncbi:MAG TPA: alpha/beta fold hydrolase, partial [Solirubrobacterales bacterium]|nr:alpha/beta fold hydrolase [Solirubrobacterales bacterium]
MAAPAWLHRHTRVVMASLVLLLIGIALAVAISWHFSSFALAPDMSPYSDKVDISAVGQDRITLSRTEASERPGYYGLAWQAGHAIVGPIEEEDTETVTRELSDVRGYLVPDTEAGLETNVYAGNPSETRGLPYRSIDVPDQLGPMPAWLIPAAPSSARSRLSRTWAIVVHGHTDNRQNGLRIAPTLHDVGLTSLLISYRKDLGAPDSPDGLYHLGETEWQDLGAAARYAVAHGARSLVLIGYSMGGALIAQFMQRSPLKDRVSGVVLDAPALDWKSIFSFGSEQMGLPGFFSLPVQWAINARIDPDWDSLDALQHADAFQQPVLLFHGIEDTVVPISDSDQFADELGSRVTYYRVPEADHTQEWNVDPALYEQRLSSFLLQIGTKEAAKNRAPGPQTERAR